MWYPERSLISYEVILLLKKQKKIGKNFVLQINTYVLIFLVTNNLNQL